MNRAMEDATVKVYLYDDLQSLKTHVLGFVTTYNFAKHLKLCAGERPTSYLHAWSKGPSTFKINPRQLIPRPQN